MLCIFCCLSPDAHQARGNRYEGVNDFDSFLASGIFTSLCTHTNPHTQIHYPLDPRKGMQSIFIEDLEVETVVGAYEEERRKPQVLVISLEIGLPSDKAFHSDSLKDTVDYAAVAELIRRELAKTSFTLLERLVQHLCDRIEERFEVSRIKMRVAKGSIVPGARQVGVTMDRKGPRTEPARPAHDGSVKPLH